MNNKERNVGMIRLPQQCINEGYRGTEIFNSNMGTVWVRIWIRARDTGYGLDYGLGCGYGFRYMVLGLDLGMG